MIFLFGLNVCQFSRLVSNEENYLLAFEKSITIARRDFQTKHTRAICVC